MTCSRVPPVGDDFTKKAMATRTMQLMNSTNPQNTCTPRAMPMKYGQNGKWMQKPVTMSRSIATRLIQCVMTKGIGCASR